LGKNVYDLIGFQISCIYDLIGLREVLYLMGNKNILYARHSIFM